MRGIVYWNEDDTSNLAQFPLFHLLQSAVSPDLSQKCDYYQHQLPYQQTHWPTIYLTPRFERRSRTPHSRFVYF